MDTPDLRTVARPGTEPSSSPTTSPRRTSTTSWKTISLLATPLVLAIGNLIDAYAAKQQAIIVGDKYYARLVGEGAEAKRLAIEEGMSVGHTRKAGIVAAARRTAEESISGSQGKARELERQGDLADDVVKEQGEATIVYMGPSHAIAVNVLHMTRMALLEHEGIEIAVDSKRFVDTQYVRLRPGTAAERKELVDRAAFRMPELAGYALQGQSRVGLSSPNKTACQ